jgi:hypothetical protein
LDTRALALGDWWDAHLHRTLLHGGGAAVGRKVDTELRAAHAAGGRAGAHVQRRRLGLVGRNSRFHGAVLQLHHRLQAARAPFAAQLLQQQRAVGLHLQQRAVGQAHADKGIGRHMQAAFLGSCWPGVSADSPADPV